MSEFLKRKYRMTFRLFDTDNDGFLTTEEMQQWAERFGETEDANSNRKNTIKEKAFTHFDLVVMIGGEDGKISEDEFVNGYLKLRNDPGYPKILQDLVHATFILLDTDGDGYIQEQEYVRFFQHIGCQDHENLAKIAFKGMDTDHDGILSYDEYRAAFLEFWLSEDETSSSAHIFGPLV